MYDPKCDALARAFLADCPSVMTEQAVQRVAQAIQDAAENIINELIDETDE